MFKAINSTQLSAKCLSIVVEHVLHYFDVDICLELAELCQKMSPQHHAKTTLLQLKLLIILAA